MLRRAQMATLKPGSATVILAALRPRPTNGEAPDHGMMAGSGWRLGAGAGGGAGGAGLSRRAFDLHVSNLGDCGVRLIRDGKIILATQVTGAGWFDRMID